MSQVRRQDSLRRVRAWHRTAENGMQVRLRGPIGSVHPFLYSDAYGKAGSLVKERTTLVLRTGGGVDFVRPDVVIVKDFGIVVRRFDDQGKFIEKQIYPWSNICSFTQTVEA